jgi:ketosteroid isomerase-like protein
VVKRGTYLTTWQKQKDGTWKVVSDIDSPDPPAQ